jgi:hypothetical protein
VDTTFWFIMLVATVLPIAITVVVLFWFFRKFRGTTGSIKGGLPADATILSIAETGMTVSSPSAGPEAPVYRMMLQVTPPGGGAPYQAEATHAVPRIFAPMILPGANIGVLVDPLSPEHVTPDWSRVGSPFAGASGAGAGFGGASMAMAGAGVTPGPTTLMTAGGTMSTAKVNVTFDAQGNPTSGIGEMVGAVQSGTMPIIRGKADQILATGTHGTAIITTAQPLGKKVRDINPAADPSRLDDPMWLFTLEVSLAGQTPFTAMMGHRVPVAKVATLAPGVKLAVAVDPQNPSQDVAIDWERSPIS